MSRIAKLYQKLLDGRQLTFAEFQRLLEAFGYRFERSRGSHISYCHIRISDTRIIQPRGKYAKPYQVQQFVDMIEEFGLTLENDDGSSLPH